MSALQLGNTLRDFVVLFFHRPTQQYAMCGPYQSTLDRVKPMTSPRTAFRAGVQAAMPILLGVVPFGMVYGAAAIGAGMPLSVTQAMSSVIFAGAAQFVTVQLFAAATPALVIILTTCLLNLRHVLYSASLATHLQHLPASWRWLLSYLMTDEAYAVAITHYADQSVDIAHKHWYFLGAGLALWTTWQVSTAGGIMIGTAIPPTWSLDFVIPLTFIALVVPALRDRASVGAALTAGLLVVALAALPFKLGLLTAMVAGMGVGIALERYGTPVAAGPKRTESEQHLQDIGRR